MKVLFSLFLTTLFNIMLITPDTREISGIVTDTETNEPIMAVIVSINGTEYTTLTSSKGEYTLVLDKQIPEGANLVFEKSGYSKVSVPIFADNINIGLNPSGKSK